MPSEEDAALLREPRAGAELALEEGFGEGGAHAHDLAAGFEFAREGGSFQGEAVFKSKQCLH